MENRAKINKNEKGKKKKHKEWVEGFKRKLKQNKKDMTLGYQRVYRVKV